MGWSCSRDAGRVTDRWTAACRESTGAQNTYTVDGETYFWELSNREHNDGSITGTIHRNLKVGEPLHGGKLVEPGTTFCRKVASFKIAGDGTVVRAPKFLKGAATFRLPGEPVDSGREVR